jgi:hypothetical protein
VRQNRSKCVRPRRTIWPRCRGRPTSASGSTNAKPPTATAPPAAAAVRACMHPCCLGLGVSRSLCVCVSVYLSIYLCVCLSVGLTVPLSADAARKSFYREFKKVVEEADVVLQVLDARDPLGCRSKAIEEAILNQGGKKIILVLNKIGTDSFAPALESRRRGTHRYMCT